jgi:DNA-binding IclR family transcriptional regulator
VIVISSQPSCPWTTNARRVPSSPSASAISFAAGEGAPINCASPGRIRGAAQDIEHRSKLQRPPHRLRPFIADASPSEKETDADLANRRAASLGGSVTHPSASSTSALPLLL